MLSLGFALYFYYIIIFLFFKSRAWLAPAVKRSRVDVGINPFNVEKKSLPKKGGSEFNLCRNYAFFFVTALITRSVAIIRTAPMGRATIARPVFARAPAMIYVTNETPATVSA